MPEPVPGRWHISNRKTFVRNKSRSPNFVYVRKAIKKKKPLREIYAGPFKVVKLTDKTVAICVNGRESLITLDRVKPAYQYKGKFINYDEDRDSKRLFIDDKITLNNQ